MPAREVLQLGHQLLHEVAKEVKDLRSPKVTRLVSDLGDTLDLQAQDPVFQVSQADPLLLVGAW